MDSKTKRIVIAFAVLMVSFVVGMVVWMNLATEGAKRKRQLAAEKRLQEQAKAQEEEVDHDLVENYHLDPARDPYAFLQDEDFFLQEENETEDPTKTLSLLASSVLKDLRIFIVDGNSKVVTGMKPEVSIRSTDSANKDIRILTDDDGDGILYADGFAPGDYELTLTPLSGYQVDPEPLTVNIAQQVSYTVIKDISFLIHTEDQVDATKEDTAVNQAQEDADGTETNMRLQDGVSIFGIDVSKWNKDIDWKKVKDSGVDFAIIRCGYRGSSSGYLIEDPFFEKNIKGATEAGVKVGIYFFTQAVTAAEGVEEASMVLSLCEGYKMAYPMFIDTEGSGGGRGDKIGKIERTEAIKAFCETIENAGYTAGIYASKSWFENNLDMEKLTGYSIWLAQYSSQATYEGEYDMWQYTSAGKVDGIGTLVDYDLSYVDFENNRMRIGPAPGEEEENPDGENADGENPNGENESGENTQTLNPENGDTITVGGENTETTVNAGEAANVDGTVGVELP